MAKIKPKKWPLGKKLARKTKKPLGILTILGGLLVLGLLTRWTAGERQPWVWEDFHKLQGNYLGDYYRRGHYLSLGTPDGVVAVKVAPTVTFKYPPPRGALVELHVTQENGHYQLVRAQDFRTVYTGDDPDPERAGHAYQYHVTH